MSVTFHLYRPTQIKEVFGKYYGMPYSKQVEIDNYADNIKNSLEFNEYFEEYFSCYYSKDSIYQLHDIILTLSKQRSGRRYNKYMKYIRHKYKEYIQYTPSLYRRTPFIVAEEICYRQGWFLKKEFFKRHCTEFYAFTKQDMINLIHRYVENQSQGIFDEFIEKFEDGMIFCISF